MKIFKLFWLIISIPFLLAASDNPKLESEKPFLGVYLSPKDDLKVYGRKI
jgi:hypothetical protein